jgi:uncharacterized protein (TIGR03083 family)
VASVGGAGRLEDADAAGTVDDWAPRRVAAERAAPAQVFWRWRARDAADEAMRSADPQLPLQWVTGAVKPATLATTRLAEYWAHGLDITGPLGIDYPNTSRLRHIAWLAHQTLPYAFSLAGESPVPVRCSLTAPDGVTTWTFGPDDAESGISGPASVLPGCCTATGPGKVRPDSQRPTRRHRPPPRPDLRVTASPTSDYFPGRARARGGPTSSRTGSPQSSAAGSGSSRC